MRSAPEMEKPISLTRRARRDYADILAWTLDTFGHAQAERYADLLERRLGDIRQGIAHVRTGAQITGHARHDRLRIVSAGQHFVLFVETAEEIRILALLHSRSDLSRHFPD